MAGVWKDAVAAAQKNLGSGGKLPKPSVDPSALEANLYKARDAYDGSRADLEKKILAFQNALSQAKNNFKQYGDMVDGNNFGLDEADPEQKKRIAATTKSLLDWIKGTQTAIDKHIEALDKLDRAVTDTKRLDNLKI